MPTTGADAGCAVTASKPTCMSALTFGRPLHSRNPQWDDFVSGQAATEGAQPMVTQQQPGTGGQTPAGVVVREGEYGDRVVAVEPGGAEFIPLTERHGRPLQLFWTWTSPNLEFATVFVRSEEHTSELQSLTK